MKLTDKLKEILPDNNKYLILLGILGLFFLFLGNFLPGTSPAPVVKQKPVVDQKEVSYSSRLSTELEETLSLMEGVGKVKVQLLVDEGSTYEYEYNLNKVNKITNETDQNGGQRKIDEDQEDKQMVIIEDAGGAEKPVIKKEKRPSIKGVIIVAQGVEDSQIKYDIYRAVSNFLGLPIYKINVLPYQRR